MLSEETFIINIDIINIYVINIDIVEVKIGYFLVDIVKEVRTAVPKQIPLFLLYWRFGWKL